MVFDFTWRLGARRLRSGGTCRRWASWKFPVLAADKRHRRKQSNDERQPTTGGEHAKNSRKTG